MYTGRLQLGYSREMGQCQAYPGEVQGATAVEESYGKKR